MGIDIHIIQPPGPVPPLPIPHPFVGMLFDPMELAPFVGASVFVNGMPKATAGSEGKALPPHIPIGGVFVPPPPGNECEMFMGSSTVLFEGEPASYLALPALSCQSVGMPAPFRPKKKPKPILKLPTSVVMPIPAGPPVLIGGPPTISMSVLAMKVAMGAAGKAAKKLRKMQKASKKVKAVSDRIHKAAKKAMDKLGVPPSVQNKVHKGICTVTGHPVDVATGKVFTDNVDFELPGPIPLRWERTWYSCSTYEGPLGHGWHHGYDLGLCEADGKIAVRLSDGRALGFPPLEPGMQHFHRQEKTTLLRDDRGYGIRTRDGLCYRFAARPGPSGIHSLAAVENPQGNAIVFWYDRRGFLAGIEDSCGRSLAVACDDRGRIVAVSAPHPEAADATFPLVRYAYDAEGDLIQVVDPNGHSWRFAYRNRLLIRETNRNGLSFHFEYDGDRPGSKCIRTWGDGGIYGRELEYFPQERLTRVRDSLGHVREFHWNVDGLVERTLDPMGGRTSREFNAFCELVRETDALGGTTAYEYDDRGNVVRLTGPDGSVFETRYEGDLPVEARDALGGEWRMLYDAAGRLLKRTDPLGHAITYGYSGDLLASVTDPAGVLHHLRYRADRTIAAVESSDGARSTWEFDRLGRCKAMTAPSGARKTQEFDRAGRPVRIEEPDGRVLRLEYDPEGNPVRVQDDFGSVRFRYQGMNRLAARQESGNLVEFHYDTEERLIGILNRDGFVFRCALDACGRVAEESGFDGPRRRFHRDPKGRVVRIDRPGGKFTEYEYDPADRILRTRYSDGETERFAYRPDGKLVEAENSAAKVVFERDILGRVVRESRGGHWVESVLDAAGRRTSLVSSFGACQRIERNLRGDVIRIGFGMGDSPSARLWEGSFRRDSGGREVHRTLPGGVEAHWHRDGQGRVLRHDIHAPAGNRTRDYRWEAGSRLKVLSDSLFGERSFGHDAAGNLEWSRDIGGAFAFRIPDAEGNLFRSPDRTDRSYGPGGRLLEVRAPEGPIRHDYDSEGNLVRKTLPDGLTWEYAWTDSGMLGSVRCPDGSEVSFAYDALGRRIGKSSAGRACHWLWDGNNPLHEWSDGTRPVSWLFEPESFVPLAKIEEGNAYSILADHGGAPIGMYDSRGGETWSAQPGADGHALVAVGAADACPFRFQGQYQDVETGLVYNRFRYLDPESGLYISRDPLQDIAGCVMAGYVFESVPPAGDLLQTTSATSPYRYVADPMVWMDPFGLVRIHTEGPVEVNAYPGPAAGGKEHLPLHAHVHEGKLETRVLMEDYYKKGKLVASKGDVYPGDPAMTKKMRKVVQGNLDSLATKTRQVFDTGSCG